MFGSVRCICGRYMRFVENELATAVSGGAATYRCRRCGSVARIWSRHGVDDEPVSGVIFVNDAKFELRWSDDHREWRVA